MSYQQSHNRRSIANESYCSEVCGPFMYRSAYCRNFVNRSATFQKRSLYLHLLTTYGIRRRQHAIFPRFVPFNSHLLITSTATRSCRDPGTAVIHLRLPGGVRRRPQSVTYAVSGDRRDTLRPPPPLLLGLRPGATANAAACWCCCIANFGD